MPRRPRAIGRDRLGILGGPVGAVAALSGTHANHAPGTGDVLFFARLRLDPGQLPSAQYAWYVFNSGGVLVLLGVDCWVGPKLRLYVNGTSYFSSNVTGLTSGIHDIAIYLDRDDLAYFFVDAVAAGTANISAQSALDLTSTALGLGGRQNAGTETDVLLAYKQFVFAAGTGPTAAAITAIVRELYQSPDNESPTLAARANYATERRVDIPFIDVDQDGTTVPNLGTGAATFTIGGGLHFHDVRTQAERAAIAIPGEDWYAIDGTHNANVAVADLGCAQGSYVGEVIIRDLAGMKQAGRVFQFGDGNESLYLYNNIAGTLEAGIFSNGVNVYHTIESAGYSAYPWIKGQALLHFIYDADANTFIVYVSGQRTRTPQAVVADLNLSGNRTYGFPFVAHSCKILAARLWNAASLPADYAAIIRRRVVNPWTVDDGFTGMTLRGNWNGRAGAQLASATYLENEAQPGIGRLAISGGATWGASRVLAVAAGV